MRNIIVQMPIDHTSLQWAESNYPKLITTKYSPKRNQYLLLNRALLQHTLYQYFQLSTLPTIGYLEHGKPYFIEEPTLSFNITHTNGHLAIIISDSGTVGIDLETIKTRKNFQALEDRVFNLNEQNWLHKQHNYLHSFFMLWSAKEAYLKAHGTGLSGLSHLQLDIEQQCALGPLQQGQLYLATQISNMSFSFYITNNAATEFYSFNGNTFEKSHVNWQWLSLNCQSQ